MVARVACGSISDGWCRRLAALVAEPRIMWHVCLHLSHDPKCRVNRHSLRGTENKNNAAELGVALRANVHDSPQRSHFAGIWTRVVCNRHREPALRTPDHSPCFGVPLTNGTQAGRPPISFGTSSFKMVVWVSRTTLKITKSPRIDRSFDHSQ